MLNYYQDLSEELVHTDSRNKSNLSISRLKNSLISFKNLKNLKEFPETIFKNSATKIGNFYVPVPVLFHVKKHFRDKSDLLKLKLLEELAHFKENDYSFIIYEQEDLRYKFQGKPAKIIRRHIQILYDNNLYELSTVSKVIFPKNKIIEKPQIMSYYPVDSDFPNRSEKLRNSRIVEQYYKTPDDQNFLFMSIGDERLQKLKLKELEKEKTHFTLLFFETLNLKKLDSSSRISPIDSTLNTNAFLGFRKTNFVKSSSVLNNRL